MPRIGWKRKQGLLIKTGQTTQYNGYADDGYYEKGLSRTFAVLTTGAQAGTTAITLNAKTDTHSNNCVYDRRTRLMWTRYVAASVGPASDGKLPWTTNGNGEGIFAYVAAANAAKLGGFSDWRIPNDLELASLRIMEAPTALPDTTAFPSFPTGANIYTSTTRPTNILIAMSVTFSSGIVTFATKTDNLLCLLVRKG